MAATSTIPLDPRQAELVLQLTSLRVGLAEFREVLQPINDEALNKAFREILFGAEQIVDAHAQRPGTSIADDIANLRSLFARKEVPREDPVLGAVPGLKALRSARGSVLADFDSVLAAAQSLGRVPNDPEIKLPNSVELERIGREGQLAALERRLRKVESDLETKIAPESRFDEGRSQQQIGLVNFYVNAMKIELTLARLEAQARDLIDFASLTRAIEAIGELTADFVATVQGLREKVTISLKSAAIAFRPTVRRVVVGLKTMVNWVRRHARRAGDQVHDEVRIAAESLSVPPPVIGQPVLTVRFPDWPIRDLFLHIHPSAFEAEHRDGIDFAVKSELLTGRLTAWGRQIQGPRLSPLAEIPGEYWRHAHFVYRFADTNVGTDAFGARGNVGMPVYADVQVNKVQALSIWPASEQSTRPSKERRRFQIGDTVQFRADTRVRANFDIIPGEVGVVVGVEPHPPQTGPTYRVQVQFPRVLVPFVFSFEYELVEPAPARMVQLEIVLKRSPHDPKERDPRYQEELRKFSKSLRAVGTIVAQRGIAFDSANVRGYPVGQFVVSFDQRIGSRLEPILTEWLLRQFGRRVQVKMGEFEAEAGSTKEIKILMQTAGFYQEARSSRERTTRFNLGEVWQSRQGRRAVIVATEDDDHRGKLHFEDSGDEEWQNWAGLIAHGVWRVETSPRPLRHAAELKEMILQRIKAHPSCPQGMSVEIERTVGNDWRAISVPPPNQHIAYADCSNYVAYIANVLSFLYGLSEE
jgi:hypothetical protein